MMDGWQPIETMPRDGTYVLLLNEVAARNVSNIYTENYYGTYMWIGCRYDDRSINFNRPCMKSNAYEGKLGPRPTHWHPLPDVPAIFVEDAIYKRRKREEREVRDAKKRAKAQRIGATPTE